MNCKSLNDCFAQISAYSDSESVGYPLFVNAENFNDFQDILHRLNADDSKKCVYVSENTFKNGLPDIQRVKQNLSGNDCCVLVGLSQCLMLQGEAALDECIDDILGLPTKGHTIVLVSHCRLILEKYLQRDIRLNNRIVLLEGEKSKLPQIRLIEDSEKAAGYPFCDGIRALLSHMERITDGEIARQPVIPVASSFSLNFFKASMYAVSVSGGIYDVLTEKYQDLASSTHKSYGTDDQWTWLNNAMKGSSSFSDFITSQFDSPTGLATHLGDVLESRNAQNQWILWLALKVFGAQANRYLTFVLSNSIVYSDFEEHIYADILNVHRDDPLFEQYFIERKQLIARLPENLPQITSYCELVGRHGKDAVYYLSDASENEEYTFMQLLDQYEWSEDELIAAINHGFPELALYMRDFVFDEVNTVLADNSFRGILTDYFKRYKSQKIRNHIDDDFLSVVNQFSTERPFFKLLPRGKILSMMDRNESQGYFFDALGVEYLSYIQAKCEQYGLVVEINIARCELPSITVKNKDFLQYFETKNISELDELKHHSQIYDYQTCPYPIYLFKELEIIDGELRRIRAQLVQKTIQKAVIISDHGASRLAVIYQKECNSVLQLDEKGEHSGRCCPSSEDPQIPSAAYEDGYAVLGNYERFRGGRRANLEVHGGASLEEVVVPIISLSLRPDNVEFYFVDPVIHFKVGQPAEIVLFSNVPMQQPRLSVEGVFYDGIFRTDKKHAAFQMPELKRTREYKAIVYEGKTNTGVELTFRIERNTKAIDLFG